MTRREIEVSGLEELQRRMDRFPGVYRRAVQKTMQAALLTIWEKVPPYPPKPPNSTYIRKGSAGRGGSLGSGISGGQQGQPDILEVKHGSRDTVGKFGTRLHYAQHVIGSRKGQQRPFFSQYWWTLPETVLGRAVGKIGRLFKVMAEELGKYLEGRGL